MRKHTLQSRTKRGRKKWEAENNKKGCTRLKQAAESIFGGENKSSTPHQSEPKSCTDKWEPNLHGESRPQTGGAQKVEDRGGTKKPEDGARPSLQHLTASRRQPVHENRQL